MTILTGVCYYCHMKLRSSTLEETEKIAGEFVATLSPQEKAVVVGLYGNLGAGKTTFTQAVAKSLGVTETVTSPTFIIEKIYRVKSETDNAASTFDFLIHIDAYRLDRAEELLHLGWQEIISNPKNLIFVEWPERVKEIMPEGYKRIVFTVEGENERGIEI